MTKFGYAVFALAFVVILAGIVVLANCQTDEERYEHAVQSIHEVDPNMHLNIFKQEATKAIQASEGIDVKEMKVKLSYIDGVYQATVHVLTEKLKYETYWTPITKKLFDLIAGYISQEKCLIEDILLNDDGMLEVVYS